MKLPRIAFALAPVVTRTPSRPLPARTFRSAAVAPPIVLLDDPMFSPSAALPTSSLPCTTFPPAVSSASPLELKRVMRSARTVLPPAETRSPLLSTTLMPSIVISGVPAKPGCVAQMTTVVPAEDGRFEASSMPLRYVWPSELDLMARIAGMRLRERWGGWRREAFTAESTMHVSVWETTG